MRFLFFLFLWWLLSALIPFVPSPMTAAKGALHLLKNVTDIFYFAAKEESLKESAENVRKQAHADSALANDDEEIVKTFSPVERKKYRRYDSTIRAQLKTISSAPPVRGKVINILAVGSDARLGSSDLHADAIHLVTISPDSGVVEIMSVPRDTYCDLGYPDTTSFNHITNARAGGMESFLKHVEEVCKRGRIHYYVEVGFSQVMGILELLGYNDPSQTLKFLRARKTLRGGDIQRSHNQAQFMKQTAQQKFPLLTGASGDLLLTAGLQFVTTNLTKEFCLGLIYALKEKGFPTAQPNMIRLRMLPIYKMRLAEMFPDSTTITNTLNHADKVLSEELDGFNVNVARLIRKKVQKAVSDSSRPQRVVSLLARFYSQRAWMQIPNRRERIGLRDSMLYCLSNAYYRLGEEAKYQQVIKVREAEDLLYDRMKENQ